MKLTTRTLNDRVHSDADAYELLEELRWPGPPVCPHCGNDKAYFLTPKNGETRATGPKRTMSVRRVWKCAKCRKQFSVLTGTVMHGTKIEIRTWLSVLVDVSSAKNGTSARDVVRKYDVTSETAWHMLQRIREGVKRDPRVRSPNARNKRPSKAEMDERLVLALTPDELARGLLDAGPRPEGDGPQEIIDAARQEAEYPADETGEG